MYSPSSSSSPNGLVCCLLRKNPSLNCRKRKTMQSKCKSRKVSGRSLCRAPSARIIIIIIHSLHKSQPKHRTHATAIRKEAGSNAFAAFQTAPTLSNLTATVRPMEPNPNDAKSKTVSPNVNQDTMICANAIGRRFTNPKSEKRTKTVWNRRERVCMMMYCRGVLCGRACRGW